MTLYNKKPMSPYHQSYYYKKVKVLILCWFDHILDSRAEICQIFRWFFGKSMTSKRHSEINWPLASNVVCFTKLVYEMLGKETQFLPRPVRRESNIEKLKELTVLIYILCTIEISRKILIMSSGWTLTNLCPP